MINAILTGIFNIIIYLTDLLLKPIDILINNFLPDLHNVLIAIGNFFEWAGGFIPYICSWLNLPQWFITFVIGYYTFKLTVPLAVHTVKIAVSWYEKLIP